MKKRYDVIGVEDLIMDLAFQIDHLPATDGFSRILDYCWQSGGNAASGTAGGYLRDDRHCRR